MDADLAAKAAAKYDVGMEGQARAWIEAVTGEKMGSCSFQDELKDGLVLCNLINHISPGIVPKASTSKMPFKQMENISQYMEACDKLGVPKSDQFQTVDLFEGKDMMQVIQNIHSLGRASQRVPTFGGPYLGAKLADANKREFTEEQLRAGQSEATFIGKGSQAKGKVATQAGMADTSRNIVKTTDAGSSDVTFMGKGSHGGATQAGMTDTSRNIVKNTGD